MQNHKYLIIIGLAAILSWSAWGLVIQNLEPCNTYDYYAFCKTSAKPALILFFVSLFFALTSTLTIAGYYLRLFLNKNEVFINHINIALRQGTLLALLTLSALGMLALSVLTWWSSLLLITAFSLIEYYFSSVVSP
jgi:Na+/melibiose symporter-like transporter